MAVKVDECCSIENVSRQDQERKLDQLRCNVQLILQTLQFSFSPMVVDEEECAEQKRGHYNSLVNSLYFYLGMLRTETKKYLELR